MLGGTFIPIENLPDAKAWPALAWSWKVERPVAKGDVTRKSGDDYAARVYVTFRVPPEKLSPFERMTRSAARAMFGDDVPDPLSPATFEAAKLDWPGIDPKRHQFVKRLLAIRKAEIIPRLWAASFGQAEFRPDGLLTARWTLADRTALMLAANLSDSMIRLTAPRGRIIWGENSDQANPWSVRWTVGDD